MPRWAAMSRGTCRDNGLLLDPGPNRHRPAMTEIRPKARPCASAGIPSCHRHFALRPGRLRDREYPQQALPHAFPGLGIGFQEVGEVEREAN
jgi:hypothetical protein